MYADGDWLAGFYRYEDTSTVSNLEDNLTLGVAYSQCNYSRT
jgi:hypothetical protein